MLISYISPADFWLLDSNWHWNFTIWPSVTWLFIVKVSPPATSVQNTQPLQSCTPKKQCMCLGCGSMWLRWLRDVTWLRGNVMFTWLRVNVMLRGYTPTWCDAATTWQATPSGGNVSLQTNHWSEKYDLSAHVYRTEVYIAWVVFVLFACVELFSLSVQAIRLAT